MHGRDIGEIVMDFWETVRVIGRRWYVAVPAFILALLGAVGVYFSVPVTYESRAVLLLSTPPTGGTEYPNGYRPGVTNPLLISSHGLDLTGALLIQRMRAPGFAADIGAPTNGSAELVVNNGTSNPELLESGPFVFIAADSHDADLARDLTQRAVAGAQGELRAAQSELNAPRSTFVNLVVVVPTTPPIAQRGNRLRAGGGTAAVGLVLCLGAIYASESLFQARARRPTSRRRRDDAGPGAVGLPPLRGSPSAAVPGS